MSKDAGTQTACDDDGHNEIEALLRRVRERTRSAPDSLLRNDTLTYCLFHTCLRAILIADCDGVGLGTLWSTREAKAWLRFLEGQPGVFTRQVRKSTESNTHTQTHTHTHI
jgi:hypothetical protein